MPPQEKHQQATLHSGGNVRDTRYDNFMLENYPSKLLPNTTQLPNYIVDELLPHLKNAEFKVLIVIVRQTIGWIEDAETGRRKDRDWISTRQMSIRSGMSERAINSAVQSLVDMHLIETWTEDGRLLETSQDRSQAGSRVYYRLATRNPSLFDKPKSTPAKSAVVSTQTGNPRKNCGPQNLRPTKETLFTKENTLQPDKPVASQNEKGEVSTKAPKPPSPHKQFVDFWWRNVKRSRGISPIITGADGRNLQRILKEGITTDTLEKAAIYFLNEPSFKRTFSPSISTFLSVGVINGIMNRMRNEPDFWKKLDQHIGTQGGVANDPKQIASFADQITMLSHRLADSKKMPFAVARD